MTALDSADLGVPEPIRSDSAGASRRFFALKHGDTFIVADDFGNILGEGDGLFRDDTRVVSRLKLTLGTHAPSLLGAAVSQDNVFFTTNLTNRPLPPLGEEPLREGVIHCERTRFLWMERLYERIRLTNYGDRPIRLPLRIDFAADFRDMFEVRGLPRSARGRLLPADITDRTVVLRYEGLDRFVRSSAISFSEAPRELDAGHAEFMMMLPHQLRAELYIEIGPAIEDSPGRTRFKKAAARARWTMRRTTRRSAKIRTSGRLFNDWLEKSRADLTLLTTEMAGGPFPYAGIPWFSTAFGRDAIVTALQTIWLDPDLARGVLSYLSFHQAREISPFQDAAPGKIMHETRKGEMNVLKELPFERYYGGADTTALFIVLAGAYAERTADMALINELWPSLVAAVGWIEGAGDSDQDGLVDYLRESENGLKNQGWKDSNDSVFHADGRQAQGPIALVEIQGYVFRAFQVMAQLAEYRGEPEAARHWRDKALGIQTAVEERFWLEDIGFYAIALDGAGKPCAVRTSNPGHLLYVGLPAGDRAKRVIEQFLMPSFNSGWGIRTLAQGEPHFNPMSYHNGSIWPHDTAMCVAGMARYGEKQGVVKMMSQAFESAIHFDMRLPELFCGFPRYAGEPPIPYPVACLPQAWASGSAFMMLQACLGLHIDGWRGEILIDRPELPVGIDQLVLQGLSVGAERVDLVFHRVGERVVGFADRRTPSSIAIMTRS